MYVRPRTLDEACEALAAGVSRVVSGGTDYFPSLGERVAAEPIIDISNLATLKGITVAHDHFRIGGRTTWCEVVSAPLPACFDALKQAAREVGSIQIQNAGTVAGNLCNASPAADGVPPLLALDAEVELRSVNGCRRLPLNAFLVGNRKTMLGADELMTAVIVPRTIDKGRSTFLKLGGRRYLVISIAMVAAVVEADADGRVAQARVAVGSCSVVATRLKALEHALRGARARAGLGDLVAAHHLTPLSPIDDIRGSAAYRRDSALSLIRRALEACVREEP